MMKRWHFLPVLAILALVLILLPARIASAAEVCGLWDTVSVLGGEYTIQNNVWGATTAQCINVPSTNSTAWSVTRADHSQGSVAAYPSIFKGCHWGDCTSNSGMPIRVSEVNTAPFSWNVSRISNGVWNIAAEAWFSPIADSTDGYNGGAELMIWLDYQGMQPAGSQVGTASIGGATWQVWYSNIGWNYIAYQRVGAVSSINADLKSFINDAMSRGYIQNSWYLHDLEAGTELMTGGTGFASNSFSFTVNGGIPPTAVPPTSVPPTGVPPTGVPPTSVPPTSVPPTTGPGVCTVNYAVQNQWGSGATVNVTVRNNGSSAIDGWTLAWTYPGNQQINQMWGGSYSQSGASVSVTHISWNRVIPANGGTAGFGMNLTFSGANNPPTNFTLNEAPCNGGPQPTQVPPTGIPPTSVPPTSVPPTSVPPTTGPGTCSVNYAIQNDWGNGATVNVTIRNDGTLAINGWTLTWIFPGNQQITNLWNGSHTQSGASVSVRDAAWNATIGANGGTVSFGVNLSYSGTNSAPTSFVLNGTVCQ